MPDKPYGFGLLIGRFQTLHIGHEDMILRALSVCDRVGIFIGSSQESGTEKNPYDYETRKRMLETVFPDKLMIAPLPDRGLGNNSRWGEHVLRQAEEAFSCLPDLIISGKEERRNDWFGEGEGLKIAELIVPKRFDVSANGMRLLLTEDRRKEWEVNIPAALHGMYPELREKVLTSLANTQTSSI